MIEILNRTNLQRARVTGRLVGDILQSIRTRAKVGTNLLEIDQWTKEMIEDGGASSCYVDYAPSFGEGPFGHYICTSVNDAVLHGMPRDYTLADGDLLTLDLAILKDGIASDSATSFIVGNHKSPEDQRLIEVTEQALAAAIDVAGPHVPLGTISHTIGEILRGAGYKVNTDFGGHGIGSTMHQDPHVPNDGRAGRGFKLRPGMLLAIEPWVMEDTAKLVTDPDDGWTLRSVTGCRTAHTEHTIAVTNSGVDIMTLPSNQG